MDSTLFRSLEWRSIGPHRGGRVVAVAGHPTERATFYFGGCAGGVWKTTNSGALWENITDGFFKSSDGGRTWANVGLTDSRHIGDIIIHPTNPNIVYVAALGHAWGTNEERGVVRTTDGGATWQK